ncbi:hypothetical protein SAMN05444365_102348 [Micromonospora pattaloongensis]|uniref:Uncharacterized protein n=1 Tax=Micromonospora pattaloongensis TaxID=405436 RepID=A0A1H3K4V3_9ACTN|nr:hypothetical protein [Micromonospora pattaloongensis]SDY46564.1 hypothetical protein SAMN05444365_102348 [Micromonospora pattaloongensis]
MSHPSHTPDGSPAGEAGPDRGYAPGAAPVSPPAPHPALLDPTVTMPAAASDAPAGQVPPADYTPPPFGAGPASAPPFGGQPGAPAGPATVPGAPGQPYPGGPVSGPGYGQPMSGVPYPAAGAGAGRSRGATVLAIVAGLLFVLGGVMTGLFIAKSSELSSTEQRLTAQVSDRDARLDANAKEIDGLKRDLETANDNLKQVEQDLAGTKNARDEQARQKEIIATCLETLGRAMAADDRGTFEKLAKEADKACKEADKYL